MDGNSENMEPVDVGVVYNRSELDIFTPPKELDPIHSTYDVSFLPITSLDNQGEVAFIINSSPDFTDFAQCTLTLVVQVTRADGSPIQSTIDYEMTEVNGKRQKGSAKSPEVSIPNAFLAALIRRMTVELNGVEIGAGSYSHFPQIMLLKTLLCHSDSYADNVLRHGMVWEKDLGSQFRSALDVGRFQFIKGSRELTLVATLNNDIFNTSRLLPPGINARVRIERSTPEYALIRSEESKHNYKIKWLDAKFTARRVKLHERVQSTIYRGLAANKPVYMPFTKLESKVFEIPAYSRYNRAHGIFQGLLPERVLLALVDTEAVGYGDYRCNPMVFPARDYKVSGVQFFVGDKAVLSEPYSPDWSNESYEREFQGLMKVMNVTTNPAIDGSCVSYKWFGRDYGIFAAKIRGFEGRDTGMVSVEVTFSEGAPKTIAGFLIGEFRSVAIIDQQDKKIQQTNY